MTLEPEPLTAEPESTISEPEPAGAKPTIRELGIDLAGQAWRRCGHGDGAIEVAFAGAAPAGADTGADTDAGAGADAGAAPGAGAGGPGPWVLMRVAGDPDRRVLVFDRYEWECFLDGARNGEFDDVAAPYLTPE